MTSWASVDVPGVDRAQPKQNGGRTPHLLEIDGTDGTLVLKADASMHLYRDKGEHQEWQLPPEAMALCIRDALQHFIDCLDSGAELETSGADTLNTMALVYACYRSAQDGQAIQMEAEA